MDLEEQTVITFMKNLYISVLFWLIGVFGVKVGILLFYWRVFHTKVFRLSVLAVGGFSLGIFISNFFVYAFQCTPIDSFWKSKSEDCIEQFPFYLASAIINVVGDITVLALPLPVVWKLHTSRRRKWSLSFVFLLGAFVCIASIFRIAGIYKIDPTDVTYSNLAGGLWGTVEVEMGFICANLPAVRPVIPKWFGADSSAAAYGSGGTGQRQYGISGKGVSRSGHVILRSRNPESDVIDSDTEALTRPGRDNMINPTNTRGTNGGRSQAFKLVEIVVKTDIGVSIDSKLPRSRDGEPNHFVQITAPRSGTVDLPGVSEDYY
ncbi:hypothetical protein AAE478_007176 [Parahypoxylon ruwenzoriense]